MQRPNGTGGSTSDETVQRFLDSLDGLHVDARVVEGEAETIEALKAIFAKAGSRRAVVAGIPGRYEGAVRAATSGIRADFVEELRGTPPGEAVGVLEAADVGVTWAVNGVALEGALLEVVYDDSAKLASSLPMVHVAMLERSSVLRDLAEAMPMVGRLVGGAPPGRKPIVSFISGPSKTGDIEMRLLYGVHGPHTVHVLVMDWR
jgi:L-lactate dehydrogenase complex protein LldG